MGADDAMALRRDGLTNTPYLPRTRRQRVVRAPVLALSASGLITLRRSVGTAVRTTDDRRAKEEPELDKTV